MVTFNEQYAQLVKDIITNGISNKGKNVRTVWKDGTPAYTQAVWGRMMRFKPEDGFPILTSKFVNPLSFSSEILWITQLASNKVQDARDLGSNVWNEWEKEDGTILKAYGYQMRHNTYRVFVEDISKKALVAMGKTIDGEKGDRNYYSFLDENDREYVDLQQMDYVIHQLIDNPYSRQIITTLWNPKETHEMALPPCVFTTHWEVMADDRLYLSVKARSSDVFLGLPFNISQYALLHRLVAQVTGWEIGDFIFQMDDAHLYDRHITKSFEFLERDVLEVPEFWIDKSVKSFQEFKYGEHFGWVGYTKDKYPPLPAPIAVGRAELEKEAAPIGREEIEKEA